MFLTLLLAEEVEAAPVVEEATLEAPAEMEAEAAVAAPVVQVLVQEDVVLDVQEDVGLDAKDAITRVVALVKIQVHKQGVLLLVLALVKLVA